MILTRASVSPAALLHRLSGAAQWLTSPLLPEDYLRLINPLWAVEDLYGRVEAVHAETGDAATLVIRPGRGWTVHRPGQSVRIGVDIDGRRHWRTFSLSSAPDRSDGRITVTVKAVRGGLVSDHLVRSTAPGAVLTLGRPEGAFVLPEPPPPRLLFVTAGSGITPVMAMLDGLRLDSADGPDIVLVHSARTPDDVIFGRRLRSLAARYPRLRLHERHTRAEGRLRPADLARLCPDWTERSLWACGPPAMLDDIAAHWTGPADGIHVERFSLAPAAAAGSGGHVRFTRSGREAEADGGTPLLAVGESAGVLMPSGCRMGICYGCVARLRSGRVCDVRTGQVHGDAGDMIQTCVSVAIGPVEIEL
ncbi:ferredoxin reductase [Microbispora bryophytorum]|uniref:ferredoxin reductase n=1 Tax=Microbispora bryophytorum TaxID=1460882 RepID=UPI00295E6674|nr:ferredoxin reductase [Microbispora camponoti]